MIEPYEATHPDIAPTAWVHATAVVIGDVGLAEHVSVWPTAVLRGDVNHIRIGARSNVQDGTVVHVAHKGPYQPGFPTLVGEDVTIGHRAIVHACTIGDRVLVGMGAVVMDGAVVEPDTILGANTLVPPGKRLAGGHLYVGSPARCVRELTDTEREQLVYSARHYVKVMQRHRNGG
ncbi:gamma carbonic anhydrase family protein [Spiribacter halobius]|uniref:Gamma carbonic anhydrase family protein n=1 Tax=Sediminicurvatus halobius TaxID=2182432 RepID=A0A2U2N6X2_9GAMM|nr:gamma carbonic anhydrase family protein [Spiribacter halobius]PWG64828.1 gamma carbonic anhydrase family protein [Spiribacter halobius]UEX78317.1 gamma carbonic anhydrase family protein [Spiribacter halobius]